MASAKRKLARLRNDLVKSFRQASKSRRPQSLVGRIGYLENALDDLNRDYYALKAEFQLASVRQQALVDYYETRIDRIYARLSAEAARSNGVAIQIAQDSQADDVILASFKKTLQIQGGYADIPLASVLSDYLEPGEIRGALTLQGFKIRRGLAQEMGNGIHVLPLDYGKQQTVLYGPYKKLLAGQYVVSLLVDSEPAKNGAKLDGGFDIYCTSIGKTFGEARFEPVSEGRYRASVLLDWSLQDAEREVEFRVYQRALRAFKIIGFDIELK